MLYVIVLLKYISRNLRLYLYELRWNKSTKLLCTYIGTFPEDIYEFTEEHRCVTFIHILLLFLKQGNWIFLDIWYAKTSLSYFFLSSEIYFIKFEGNSPHSNCHLIKFLLYFTATSLLPNQSRSAHGFHASNNFSHGPIFLITEFLLKYITFPSEYHYLIFQKLIMLNGIIR